MKDMQDALADNAMDIPISATIGGDTRISERNAEGVLYELLSQYLPQIVSSMDRQIVLDSGAVVGELAPAMDTRLGIISGHKGRGN